VELFPSLSILNSRVWWVDYDGDSRIDFAATGVSTNSGQAGDLSFLPGLYSDQGLNQFARDSSVWFRVTHGDRHSAGWADFDNDNRPDFLIMGATNSGQ